MSAEDQFTYIKKLLEEQSARLDRIDQRLDGIDQRLDHMDQRFDGLDQRLDRMDQRFDRMDQRFDRLDEYVLEFRREMINRLEAIEERLSLLDITVTSMTAQVGGMTKSTLQFGSRQTALQNEQARQKNVTADLIERIAKLEELVALLAKPAA
jgi:archaellum component FlaC